MPTYVDLATEPFTSNRNTLFADEVQRSHRRSSLASPTRKPGGGRPCARNTPLRTKPIASRRAAGIALPAGYDGWANVIRQRNIKPLS